MKLALVGNNDGPLRILRSLQKKDLPVCVGLQKAISRDLENQYLQYINVNNFYTQFGEDLLFKILEQYQPEIVINCFCNFKFVKLLNIYKVFNVHLSALPRYRGRHPLHWALINGEQQIGITIHEMTFGFDEGPIYWQKKIRGTDNLSVSAAREELLQLLEDDFQDFMLRYKKGEITPHENLDEEATLIKRRIPADSELTEWGNRDLIFRKVWALCSEKNPAFITINNQEIPVKEAEKINFNSNYSEGRIVDFQDGFVEVSCGGRAGIRLKLLGHIPNFKIDQDYI
ncbi:formyltransferase family protein [Autumnicola edwardsiae]|uniref:Formyltransferase family protein n=1 Tax=Autumnicola edwardsiae TaxID=3075594 RepID=A0ABU3CRV9_9FLAO|nr:formyltransferase family protein [Zunongwangia sp. F297]MDT0649088.1 formyltransferase family protein [Zunongwangia sp. F297]